MNVDSLTDEQRSVSTAGPEVRMLVNAGPGTGKTHTLVARLAHLVDHHDVRPGGLLALSFSRAAVTELRSRLRSSGTDAARVAPITFDSFATRLLAEIEPDGAWTERSYDGRIQVALDRVADCSEYLADIEHVCIDEVQDLVGVRMRFVKSLLEHMNVGFTLLGDEAQGIYDFTLQGGETAENDGSPAFHSWVRSRYAGELIDVSLSVNHRARSEVARAAAAVGARVIADPLAAADELMSILDSAPWLPDVAMLRLVSPEQRTAVLCHDNGDALLVSRALHEAGIGHALQRGATNRTVAPWVARMLRATGGGVLTESRFANAVAGIGGDAPEPEIVWPAVRRVARDPGGVDLSTLVRRMRTGVVPDELHTPRTSSIVVSTVHRAKGLEFDRVVVIKEGWRRPFDVEAARTMFVAVSRTIEILASAARPAPTGYLLKDKWTDRWVEELWKGRSRQSIEIDPGDVDTGEPFGAFLDHDPAEIQELLWHEVRPGDPVRLRFVRVRAGAPGALYAVEWNGRDIAMMSERFGETLLIVLKKSNKWRYPRVIEGLTVDAVRTVAGDSTVTDQAGIGPGGAWLAPALVGLGRFNWKDTDARAQ